MPRRETYKKVFRNEKVLKEMLELRSKGWSYPALAARYGCDHSSIIWQVKKHGVEPLVPVERIWINKKGIRIKRIYETVKKPQVNISITEEDEKKGARKMNQGKDYAGYLKESKIKLVDMGGWKIGTKKKIVV